MKKLFALLLLLVVFNRYVQATEWTVNVSNFQFSPSSLNVVVGDVVKFVWVSGFHTTTSTSVPSGANTWDAPIQSPGQTFSYTMLKAGTYNYKCTPHASGGMIGSFTASPNLPVLFKDFSVNSTKSNAALLKWSTASE